MFSAEFLYFECPGASHAHCASLAISRTGELVAAWYVYPEEETKHAQIVLTRKSGAEATWPTAKPVDLGVSSSVGNPTLFLDPSGTLWLHFVTLKRGYWDTAVWSVARSDDMGRTFSSPRIVSKEEGLMVRHPPVVLPSGTALIAVYSDRTRHSALFASRPPYEEWTPSYTFASKPLIQPSLVRMDERLVLFFRPSEEPRFTWRSISSDDGKNWSDPVRLPLPNPLSGISACVHDGRAILVFNNSTQHQRFPIAVSMSEGNLHTWTDPTELDNPGFEVSYPSFLVDPKGIIHGVYTYNRKFIKYVCFNTAWLREPHEGD